MKVFVNDRAIEVLPGMRVKHALISAGLLGRMEFSGKVCDAWGNEVGLEGALSEGMKIYVTLHHGQFSHKP